MMLLCSIGFFRRALFYTYFYDADATICIAEEQLKNYKITNYPKNSSMWLFYYDQKANVKISKEYELHQQIYSAFEALNNFQNVEYDLSKFKS